MSDTPNIDRVIAIAERLPDDRVAAVTLELLTRMKGHPAHAQEFEQTLQRDEKKSSAKKPRGPSKRVPGKGGASRKRPRKQ